jgi:hypothetical protein
MAVAQAVGCGVADAGRHRVKRTYELTDEEVDAILLALRCHVSTVLKLTNDALVMFKCNMADLVLIRSMVDRDDLD